MIYDLHHCYLFIHIPRTAGVAITRALAGVSSHCVVDLTAGRHMTAAALKERLGDRWHQFRPWAVARSPWDIVLSDYRLTLRDLRAPCKLAWRPAGVVAWNGCETSPASKRSSTARSAIPATAASGAGIGAPGVPTPGRIWASEQFVTKN